MRMKLAKRSLCLLLAFILCLSPAQSLAAGPASPSGGAAAAQQTREDQQKQEKQYKVSLNEISNGSLYLKTPEEAEPTLRQTEGEFAKDESVTVVAQPDKDCKVVKYSVLDSSGKEIEAKETSDTEYTFSMPKKDVTVTAVIAMELKEKEIPVPDQTLEVSGKEQEAVTDELTMQYLSEHADGKYTKAEKMELANAITLKQLMVDMDDTNEKETIDKMWDSNDWLDKYIAQIDSVVCMYNLSDESKYYVGYVDTMHREGESLATDWLFAENNDDGIVVDDCIFDPWQGIAYIPKDKFVNKDGENVINGIQLQIMQRVRWSDLDSTVQVINDINGKTEATETTQDMFTLDGLTVQTQPNLKEEEMAVIINGVPTGKEYYNYDPVSGQITFPNDSSASFQTVQVKVDKKNVIEKIMSYFEPITAKADTVVDVPDGMKYMVDRKIKLPGWVKTGTRAKGKVPFQYDGRSGHDDASAFVTPTYIPGNSNGQPTEERMLELAERIVNGKDDEGHTGVGNTSGKWVAAGNLLYHRASFWQLGNVKAQWEKASNQGSGNPIDWSQFALPGNKPLGLRCGHPDQASPVRPGPLGNSKIPDDVVVHGKYTDVYRTPAGMNFLKVDREKGYAIIGMATAEALTQTGVGIWKIKITTSGSAYAVKTLKGDSSTHIGGAVYTVYTKDSNGDYHKAKTTGGTDAKFTTLAKKNTSGYYSNKISLEAGTYYAKETTAPSDMEKDDEYHKFEVTAGGTKPVPLEDSPKPAYVVIDKFSKEHPKTHVSGAVFTIYTNKSGTVAKTTDGETAKITTTKSKTSAGYYSTRIKIKPGTYYWAETTTPEGYKTSGYNKPSDETVFTVKAGQTKDLTGVNKINNQPIPGLVYIRKLDATTGNEVKGAKYTVYTDAKCTKKAKTWSPTCADCKDGGDAVFTTTDQMNSSGFFSNHLHLKAEENGKKIKYYVKETYAPSDYELNPKIYWFNVQAGYLSLVGYPDDYNVPSDLEISGKEVEGVVNYYYPGNMEDSTIIKYDYPLTVMKMDAGSGGSPVADAKYGVYKDKSCTALAKKKDTTKDAIFTTQSEAPYSNKLSVDPGTYYLKEMTSPEGYELNTKVYPFKKGVWKDDKLYLGKDTASRVYTVYEDAACTKAVKISGNPAKYTITASADPDTKIQSNGLALDPSPSATGTQGLIAGHMYYLKAASGDATVYMFPTPTPKKSGDEVKFDPAVLGSEGDIVDEGPAYGTLKKVDRSNQAVVLGGAEYTVYEDEACTKVAKTLAVGEMEGGEDAVFTTYAQPDEFGNYSNVLYLEVDPTTKQRDYWVKETVAPDGYAIDPEPHKYTVTEGKAVEVEVSDIPTTTLTLKKVSGLGDNVFSNYGRNYSLTGAVYEIYKDAACTQKATEETLVTDANGNSKAVQLEAGTYYVKEVRPSLGHALCTETHQVTLTEGSTEPAVVQCTEPPIAGNFKLKLKKYNALTQQSDANMAGAEFTVRFYPDGNTNGTPKKTWVFKTDETAGFTADEQHLVPGSDALFKDASGKVIFPLGTYTIKETKAPKYYLLEGTMQILTDETIDQLEDRRALNSEPEESETPQASEASADKAKAIRTSISRDKPIQPIDETPADDPDVGEDDGEDYDNVAASVTDGLTFTVNSAGDKTVLVECNGHTVSTADNADPSVEFLAFENSVLGSIKVEKFDGSGKPLAGVTFDLLGEDGTVLELTTDENGIAKFEELPPQKYTLTEVQTAQGQQLLADNVDITLPMEATDAEVQAQKLDTSKGRYDKETNTWCFYDLTIDVTDSYKFVMPVAGGDDHLLLAVIPAIALLGGGTLFLLRRRRRKNLFKIR